MSYELRPYQKEASDTAVHNLKTYHKPFVIVAATGAGKSLIIADICHQLNEPVLILQPSREILVQNFNKLKSYGVDDVSMYSASVGSKEIAKYTYATIGSIYRKPELFKHFKYVIIDECHQVNPKNLGGMYTSFLKAIGTTNVCGLTATPYRLAQKYFKRDERLYYTAHLKMVNRIHPFFFKKIAYKIETEELIQQGYLAPIKYRSDEIDWSKLKVNSTGADFTDESVEAFWTDKKLERLARTIQFIDKHAQRNLVFLKSVSQAKKAVAMLETMGIRSFMVTGETPPKEREALIDQFKRGVVKHMINVKVFTTGFDVPELDSIVLAQPTMSLALYYQMVGRGVRKDPERPDKMLRVFDFAGCVSRMGRVESIRIIKEPPPDDFKDMVISEAGVMTEVPLFEYVVKKKMFKSKKEETK